MIPTFLLLGFVASSVRRGWTLIALASVIFAVYLPYGNRLSDSGNAFWFSLLGGSLVAANAAVGFGVGRALKWVVMKKKPGSP